MKVAVVNDIFSATGEKTFWHVLVEELGAFPVEFNKGQEIPEDTDLVITNSLWGKITDKPYISLVQDSYLTMATLWARNIPHVFNQMASLVHATERVSISNFLAKAYEKVCGKFNIIPMGVNTDLFKPLDRKEELREKYNIPKDVKVNIWVGSHHPVKGLDILDITHDFWILVFKDHLTQVLPNNAVQFTHMPHDQLAELYNCADECVSTSRVEGGGLVVIEAMFCGVPVRAHRIGNRAGVLWDWYPDNVNPRQEAFNRGLDMPNCMRRWKELVKVTLEKID